METLENELYRKVPWAISKSNNNWCYQGITANNQLLHKFAVFSDDYTDAKIYNLPDEVENIQKNGWHSLSLFPTDQIWLAPLLADRKAAILHSAGVIINGKGLIFVGHSSAGKTTTVRLLRKAVKNHDLLFPFEVLCDDRNIIRRWPEGWRVHGTWSHGDIAKVSSSSAPLHAIIFLEKGLANQLTPLLDRKEIWRRLLGKLIKPFVTTDWWQKELDILEELIDEIPAYVMIFDKSGQIISKIIDLVLDDSSNAN